MTSLIIFDLDGTLINSRVSILWSLDHALEELGLEDLEYDRRRALQQDLYRTIKDMEARHDMEFTEEQIHLFIHTYREHHTKKSSQIIAPFDGIPEILKELKKKYLLAVATTKHTHQAKDILNDLGIASLLDHIQGTDAPLRYKPEPDIINETLLQLSKNPSESVYVGDGLHDMHAAKAAKMRSAAVLYSYGHRDELLQTKPDFLLESPKDLLTANF